MHVPHPHVDPHTVSEVSHKIVDAPIHMGEKILNPKKNAFERFPLLFTLLGAFGIVAIFYGFEHLIDRIDILANNPFILLATGIAALVITGTLYKKL